MSLGYVVAFLSAVVSALDAHEAWKDGKRGARAWLPVALGVVIVFLGFVIEARSGIEQQRVDDEVARLKAHDRVIRSFELKMRLVALANADGKCGESHPAQFLKHYRATLFKNGEPGATFDFVSTDGGGEVAPGCGAEFRFTYRPAESSTILGRPIPSLCDYENLHFDVGGLVQVAGLSSGVSQLNWTVLLNGSSVAEGKERWPLPEISGDNVYVAVDLATLREQLAPTCREN